MTRPQRRVHLIAWLIIGPLALVAAALAIVRHAPSPSVTEPPASSVSEAAR